MSKNPEALRIIARQMNNAETFRTDDFGIEAACLRDSADEIERLRIESARLREALRHCANSIAEWERKPEGMAPFLLGALDNARAALKKEEKG